MCDHLRLAPHSGLASLGPRVRQILIKHHMCVEATNTKGVDGTASGHPGSRRWPPITLFGETKRYISPINFWIGLLYANRRRDGLMHNGKDRLKEPGNACHFERMAYIGFHTPQRHFFSRRQKLLQRLGKRLHFGCITNLRRRRMRFHKLEVSHLVRRSVSTLDRFHLPFTTRRPKALATSITAHTNALDYGPNWVLLCDGIFQTL